MFIITVSQDFAVGTVYTTRELAEISAIRMGLREYQILQVFAKGQRVVFRESETGPEELGVVRESLDTKFYMVDLDDGTGVEAFHVELAPAPLRSYGNLSNVIAKSVLVSMDIENRKPESVTEASLVKSMLNLSPTNALTQKIKSRGMDKSETKKSLSAALLATIEQHAEYDHPCDSDEGDLSKAHGAVSIHVLRELLARHS